ncbi:MAG: ATP-binding protein [Erysipelotrichales bacterium]|nr:ATP-binding protein [Erysipelotrichales bacterium]
MSKKIENSPAPDILMKSMRSIGYSFKTAIADILDNSISAHATEIRIYTPINDDNIFVSILDNGEGMDRGELLNAMKYGSNRDGYGINDLGRFGLGLKSASLSQCKVLTVVSKKENLISGFSWDLDSVCSSNKWECLELSDEEISTLPTIEKLKNQERGTLVVWQNFDMIFKKSDGHVREMIVEEVDETEKHLSLVFHRYLNSKTNPISIFINDDRLIGLDPFLENHPKTDSQKPNPINCEGSNITIQQFILPHQSDLSNSDIDKLGGIDSLRNGQGFYIYRNDRLIIYGTWFRLASTYVNSELYKYGRIKVDIPNTLDDIWEIDIKKQNAAIPRSILNSLKRAVVNVRDRSKKKTSKRSKLTLEKDDTKIWNKCLNRSGKEEYFINPNSQFLKNFLNEFEDSDKTKILNFIDILSSSIPYDDIYNSMCNSALNKNVSQDKLDAFVLEGVKQFNFFKQILQCNNEKAFEKIRSYEPYNNDEIFNAVKERINNEK